MVRRQMLLAALAATSTALSTMRREAAQDDLRTIEVAPGVTQIVTEEKKWELLQEGKHFRDITKSPKLASVGSGVSVQNVTVTYPSELSQQSTVEGLIGKLDGDNIWNKLEKFTEFHNRYYTTDLGKEASDWLREQVQAVVDESGVEGITVKAFEHEFKQDSIIATVPGKSTDKIVVGGHLDSINLRDRENGRAPGADDNGSGTMTILEALRVLLTDPTIAAGEAAQTLEFHWYAGEEAGLLGSNDLFETYAADGEIVKGMLQQDMTGYGNNPLGVVTDNVDEGLTEFIKKVIDEYVPIGYVETECGYGCSDHASASAAGYPASFVFEADFDQSSPYIHTQNDIMDHVNREHMLEHAKLVLGYAYELAVAELK